MTEKRFNLFDEYAPRCVHLLPQEEEFTSSSCWDIKMCTSCSVANSQRMQTKINAIGIIDKIRI